MVLGGCQGCSLLRTYTNIRCEVGLSLTESQCPLYVTSRRHIASRRRHNCRLARIATVPCVQHGFTVVRKVQVAIIQVSHRGSCNRTVTSIVSGFLTYEGHLESKERFAIQRYLLIIGKKQNMQVLSDTFNYFST